jgi:hypothetical protein
MVHSNLRINALFLREHYAALTFVKAIRYSQGWLIRWCLRYCIELQKQISLDAASRYVVARAAARWNRGRSLPHSRRVSRCSCTIAKEDSNVQLRD